MKVENSLLQRDATDDNYNRLSRVHPRSLAKQLLSSGG